MTGLESALEPSVRKLGYWAELDEADQQALRDLPHRTKTLERHGFVVREREKTTQSCLLASGFAISRKIVGDRARQIVAVHMKGDMVDLQNSLLGVADHSVQMITEGCAAFIPRDAIQELAFKSPNIGRAMWIDTLVDGSIFREWIVNLGRRDAYTRLAHLLCELSLRLKVAGLGDATGYELPMTQDQIADCIGLTAAHVNRMLKAIEVDGLIERRSARTVVIDDWKKLAAAGDFDSTYLHLREGEPALN